MSDRTRLPPVLLTQAEHDEVVDDLVALIAEMLPLLGDGQEDSTLVALRVRAQAALEARTAALAERPIDSDPPDVDPAVAAAIIRDSFVSSVSSQASLSARTLRAFGDDEGAERVARIAQTAIEAAERDLL